MCLIFVALSLLFRVIPLLCIIIVLLLLILVLILCLFAIFIPLLVTHVFFFLSTHVADVLYAPCLLPPPLPLSPSSVILYPRLLHYLFVMLVPLLVTLRNLVPPCC